ncbi:MAG TPA: N-acetyltransferase [Phycisphaerales bacterium]|nr:N-acetyltransferase [Phycisphaerales bacterium]
MTLGLPLDTQFPGPPPRPIVRGQEASVHALIDRCYREFGLALNLDDECESHLHDPGASFRAGGGEFWVLTDGSGEVRATVAISLDRGASPPGAELKSLYVDPSWRRRGLGRALTLWVVEAARVAGARELVLWSDTRFTPAHAMYESLGFARFGRRDIADSNNSSEWGYRLGLGSPGASTPRSTRAPVE